MEFVQATSLSDLQKNDIRGLEAVCQQHDKLQGTIFLSNEINFDSEIKCFFMLYEGDTLISFLSIFIPTLDEAKISAYTLPEHRRQGYFRALLHKAFEELKAYSVESILFVHEPTSSDAKLVLEKFNAKYEYSEYLLLYEGTDISINPNGQITLEQYSNQNIEDMVALDMDIFKDNYEGSYFMVKEAMESKDVISYFAYLSGEMVGACKASLEGDDISIFGFGISTRHQGKGYGKEMLKLLLDRLVRMDFKSISLEVSNINARTYNLYRKNGFEIKTQFDYYRYLIG